MFLLFLLFGLGHVYSGKAQKGIILYLGQYLGLLTCMMFLFIYPSLVVLVLSALLGFAYFIYFLIDSIQISKKSRESYQLKKYNRWYFYLGILLLSSFIIHQIISNSIKKQIIQVYKIPVGSLKPISSAVVRPVSSTIKFQSHLFNFKENIISPKNLPATYP